MTWGPSYWRCESAPQQPSGDGPDQEPDHAGARARPPRRTADGNMQHRIIEHVRGGMEAGHLPPAVSFHQRRGPAAIDLKISSVGEDELIAGLARGDARVAVQVCQVVHLGL